MAESLLGLRQSTEIKIPEFDSHLDVSGIAFNGLEHGVQTFSIASDAHDMSQLGCTALAEEILIGLGVPDERIWRPALPARVTGSHLTAS